MSTNEVTENRRYPHRSHPEGPGIELIDYLRVIWEYRFWISGTTLISALTALAISFILPAVWEVSVVIEPGRFGADVFEPVSEQPRGRIYQIDGARNIETKILQGSYDAPIRAGSGWPPGKRIEWNVSVEKDTSAIKASLEVKDKDVGIKALDILVNAIESELKEKIQPFQREFEQRVAHLREDILRLEKDIQWTQFERDANIKQLKEEIRKLKSDIMPLNQWKQQLFIEGEDLKKNAKLLVAERNDLMKRRKPTDDPLAIVLCITSLHQTMSLLNRSSTQLNDAVRELEEKRSLIEKSEIEMTSVKKDALMKTEQLQSDIRKIQAKAKVFEERKAFLKPIKIIQKPTISHKPVRPKKLLNCMVAGILGLAISVFTSFLSRYISGKNEQLDPLSHHNS